MASGGHSIGDRSPPHLDRPRRDRQLPRRLDDYDVDLPLRHDTGPLHSRSTSSLVPAITSRMLDLSVSHSVDDIAKLATARFTQFSKPSDIDDTDETHRKRKIVRTPSRPDSPNSEYSSSSGRNDNKELLELLKQQMVAMEGAAQRQVTVWLERERLQSEREAQRERLQAELQIQREHMQAQTLAELAKQQAERERVQAETSRQSIQLLTEALQNQSPRPSARSSRRTSRRGSRQHSPEQRSTGGRNQQDPLPGINEESGGVAAQLANRLQELEDEMQDRHALQCIVAPDASQAPPPLSSQSMAPPTPAARSLPRPADTGQLPPPSNSQPPVPRPRFTPRLVAPYLGETTFPDFTKEDRSQYTELRMCLETLLTASQDERYKYALLLRHVKVPRAHNIALAYAHSTTPYSDALAALDDRYGRPWDFVLQELREIEKLPPVKDDRALDDLSVRVQSLVGMLQSQQQKGVCELYASSNVERILNKLPKFRQERFRRQRNHLPASQPDLSLIDLSNFLRTEVRNLGVDPSLRGGSDPRDGGRKGKSQGRLTTVMLQNEGLKDKQPGWTNKEKSSKLNQSKAKPHCPYCDEEHWLHACADFQKMNQQEVIEWIKTNRRCWRCARQHKASECNLKKRCNQCQATHLNILHDINRRDRDPPAQSPVDCHYIDPAKSGSAKVMLKIVRVHLRHRDRVLDTYAVLDDGSERTLLLASAANKLGLQGRKENLSLRTIRRDLKTIEGERVAFAISPADQPNRWYQVGDVFTSKHIGLSQYDYPIQQLQERFQHLRHLPIPPICEATPTLLIGSDHTDLITPVSAVYLGPRGCPAAIKTRLGWTLQGPIPSLTSGPASVSCLYSKMTAIDSTLLNHVERLWQLDILPFKCEKQMVRSKEDKYAVTLLEQKTTRVKVQGVQRYATPLLRRENMPKLHVPKEVVSNYLRNTERRLAKNPQQAAVYREEMNKLVVAGHVKRIDSIEAEQSQESWYLPHHKVSHNGKDRVVFNCSFQVGRQCLNRYLLPGPTLGPSLLGVLMRFRQDKVAISGDIKGMFHQVRLLEEDKPLLRFLWRDNPNDGHPSIYQWQVLPFGTTCSPCCAIFALQQHVSEDPDAEEDVRYSIERCFYVDNCLQSVATEEKARTIIIKLRTLLSRGGFDLRQWASSNPNVLSQLPPEAKARSSETWMAHNPGEAQEMTLGLVWHFKTDTLHYRHTPPEVKPVTRRSIYSTLASQYDPLGYILPYTTRAKVLVRELWAKEQGWDDPLPDYLAEKWKEWEEELPLLREITLPRSYFPPSVDLETSKIDLHVFSDASETAYGSVVYLRTTDNAGDVHLAFVLARSRVAPRKQQSIPRLELCAALVGAQLARMVKEELTLPLDEMFLWSDSMTVITWLQSQSCRYKVFVGTRVSEIQDLVGVESWRYVDTGRNPADIITRGDSLASLSQTNPYSHGPDFLRQPEEEWPKQPPMTESQEESELKRSLFCGLSQATPSEGPEMDGCLTLEDLQKKTFFWHHRELPTTSDLSAADYAEAELLVLIRAQRDSFPEDLECLQGGKPVPSDSRLLTLAPELDAQGLIRVGGRLRRALNLVEDVKHPIVLGTKHRVTELIIQKYDQSVCHAGAERVFAEIRRRFWILQGREAVRRFQRTCTECQRWRAQPAIPKMADLPPCRLKIGEKAFHSTGVDCFGPFLVKRGRGTEKRWGIVYKCMTTRAVHIELLQSMSTDSFLMSFRRFQARRGTPATLLSDHGTNFKGGESELRESFEAMTEEAKTRLASAQVHFQFNPPNAPHFGGTWEREVRSIKTALYTVLGAQTVGDEVLATVLTEIEGVLNSKPLGYVSTDIADVDPVTPNYLLMGRLDPALPQSVYNQDEMRGRRMWRHSQVLADQFWSHFLLYYLPSLQARQKWVKDKSNLTVGTVVLIVDQSLPRATWPVGKVSKVIVGFDGKVRAADVLVKGRTYTRPVARLIELPAFPGPATDDLPPDPVSAPSSS